MTAGRELDAIVAEKVMGVRIYPCRSIDHPYAIGDEHGHFDRFIPRYSTSISAAWQIVDKLRSDGWNINLYLDADLNTTDAVCLLHGYTGKIIGKIHEGRAKTMPEAIVHAALKTAMVPSPLGGGG